MSKRERERESMCENLVIEWSRDLVIKGASDQLTTLKGTLLHKL